MSVAKKLMYAVWNAIKLQWPFILRAHLVVYPGSNCSIALHRSRYTVCRALSSRPCLRHQAGLQCPTHCWLLQTPATQRYHHHDSANIVYMHDYLNNKATRDDRLNMMHMSCQNTFFHHNARLRSWRTLMAYFVLSPNGEEYFKYII